MKKKLKIGILCICIFVFLFSAYQIIQYFLEQKENKETQQKLIEESIIQTPNAEEVLLPQALPISVDFSKLKEKNSEIIGWIYIPNTEIHYPVLQGKDNEKYLKKSAIGKNNRAGSIFMDYRNNSNLLDDNTIIYGHNMKNGSMFGNLQAYKDQEYYNTHKEAYYFTPDKIFALELVFGYTTSSDDKLYSLEKIDETVINEMKEKTDFKSDVEVSELDKFLTLSTCAYETEDARYVVVCALRALN